MYRPTYVLAVGDDVAEVAESDRIDFAQWSLDYRVEPDDIIKQLIEQANADTDSKTGTSTSDDAAAAYVHETDDSAFISRTKNVDAADETHHAVAAAFGDDTDTSCDDARKLAALLKSDPQLYKHCVLEIERDRISACPLDRSVARIHINPGERGCTFHGDEVLVKIGSPDGASPRDNGVDKVWGSVVGVMKRLIDPRSRCFVCRVDSNRSRLMVPTDLAVPKIRNLEIQQRRRSEEERRRQICVYSLTNQKIKFDRFESVSSAGDEKLFMVQFLSWKEGFRSPLGVVIGTTSAGTTAASAANILSIEYFIVQQYKTATVTEVEQLYPGSYRDFPPTAVEGKADYRGRLVFTIDGPDTKDLDDALSVEQHADGSWTVCVHIADVAYFVEKGGSVDAEACARGMSHYPAIRQRTNMIPARLSEQLCSLMPDVDRLTVTVSARVDANYDVQSVNAARSVIHSQHRLSYSFVESVLADVGRLQVDCPPQLRRDVLLLEQIARNLRRKRLGESHSMLSLDDSQFEHPRANLLVEELMIFANHQVAKCLTAAYPSSTPIRVQSAPAENELDSWRAQYADIQRNMFALSPLLESDGYRSESTDDTSSSSSLAVGLLSPLWKTVVSESSKQDVGLDKLFGIICNPSLHSQTAVALSHLRRVADRSKFVSSGEVPRDQWPHCSQNLSVYTNFTSPLRRYVDLVVQRMLVACIDKQPCPYSAREVVDICLRVGESAVRGSGFEKASRVAGLCLRLQERPICSYAFVEKPSLLKLSLDLPPLSVVLDSSLELPLSALKLSKAPLMIDGELQLSWSQRLYEVSPQQTKVRRSDESLHIDPDQHVVKLSGSTWQRMLKAALLRDAEALRAAVDNAHVAQTAEQLSSVKSAYTNELTSEGSGKQFCQYSLSVRQSSVLLVQLSTELLRGVLRPRVQLLRLTSRTCICVEHNEHPVRCFAVPAPSQSALREHYTYPQQYQKLWLPLLRAEAAVSALTDPNPAVIRNVHITWTQKEDAGCRVGTFKISTRFCEERRIRFGKTESSRKREIKRTSKWQASPGYLCVQYGDSAAGMPDVLAATGSEASTTSDVLWVGHCVVTDLSTSADEQFYEVCALLCHSSSTFPAQLLTAERLSPATVEWLPKTFPDM